MRPGLLRIKRSFHCEDLQSIVDMHMHAAATADGGGGGDSSTRRRHPGDADGGGDGGRRWSSMSVPNSPRKRIKRQRAISDLSIDFLEEIPTTASTTMTPSTSPSSTSSSMDDDDDDDDHGCLTPKASGSSSSARLITPATSHAAVVSSSSHHHLDNNTTRGTPSTTSFDFILAPRNHRDRCRRNSIDENDATSPSSSSSSSSSFPATAALERSMLLRSYSTPLFPPYGNIDDCPPSFDEEEFDVAMMVGVKVDGPSSVPNAAACDNLDSPRRVEDFPWGWDEGGGIAAVGGGGGGTQEGTGMGSSFSSTASGRRLPVSPPARGYVKSSSPSPSPPPYVSFAESAMTGHVRWPVPFLPSRETTSADGGVRQLVEALSRL